MISLRHTLPTPVLPLSVVAFLPPLFETEGIVFPQETESHGKRDFLIDFFNTLYCNFLQCRAVSAATMRTLFRVQMQKKNAKPSDMLRGCIADSRTAAGPQTLQLNMSPSDI